MKITDGQSFKPNKNGILTIDGIEVGYITNYKPSAGTIEWKQFTLWQRIGRKFRNLCKAVNR